MKLASRFRPRFSECLLLPRSDEKSFSSDDPRWIHAGRTTDGPTDRPTGRIRFGERDRTAGARLRLAFRRLYRNHDDVKRSTLASKYSRRDFFFSFFLFFFPQDRSVPIETSTTRNDRERERREREREEEEEEPPRRILLGRGRGYRVLFRRMITSFVQRARTGSRVERERKQLFIWDHGGRGGLKACALYGYWQQLFYNADNCWRAGATVTGVAVASASGARW